MKNKIKYLIGGVVMALALVAMPLVTTGCKAPHLEAGGAYAPTNALGQVIYNEVGLAVADATYKLAYETVSGVMKFEKSNQQAIFSLSPSVGLKVKHELDIIRPQVIQIDRRWAAARKAYKLNPTPAGLTGLQSIISEIQRLIPVAQSQMPDINAALTQPTQ